MLLAKRRADAGIKIFAWRLWVLSEHHETRCAARKRQKTEEFRSQYAARASIEATHEQAIRRCGLRQYRYIGQAKTYLQHVLTAMAINLVRVNDWWTAGPHA